MIEVISTVKEIQLRSDSMRREGKTIALVPTMGFLHEGHLSLIRMVRRKADDVIVSIFVNPIQFGTNEDLDNYPKSLDRDIELAHGAGADVIFTPDNQELYPEDFETLISLKELPGHLCGISRPVHFRGVATVVAKLFLITKPHISIFGEKDFQQLCVIRRMAKDLNFDIEIIGAPIVREPDGLAMSSRNSYLTPEQRKSAISLSQSLQNARAMVESGTTNVAEIIRAISEFIQSHTETNIDYIAVCDPETLDDIDRIERPALIALAVKVGKTRLIDNSFLTLP